MAIIKLQKTNGGFQTVAEGRQNLVVKSAKALPSARPQHIEIMFADENGATLFSKHDINNDKAMFVFTLIANATLGDVGEELDVTDLVLMQGKYVDVDVKHTIKPSTKDPNETVTFANISKVHGKGTAPISSSSALD